MRVAGKERILVLMTSTGSTIGDGGSSERCSERVGTGNLLLVRLLLL